MCNSFLI